MPRSHLAKLSLGVLVTLLAVAPAEAKREYRTGGKLLLAGGVTSVDGTAGGGLATWAVIGGDETRDGVGASANLSYVPLADFSLTGAGAKVGLYDRLELSYQHQSFDTHQAGATLGLGRGFVFHQDVFGAKLRVAGDAIYDDRWFMPQIAIGAEYHRADRGAIIQAIGGAHDKGMDFYVSATKVLLGESLVVDATLRATKANQFGLLGFGGDRDDRYSAEFEGSVGYLLTRKLVVGGEFRTKPDNLGFAAEQNAYDLFAAYAVCHGLTLTAAYVDLGSIATVEHQRGSFLSMQVGF